jgi:hypothetical protein
MNRLFKREWERKKIAVITRSIILLIIPFFVLLLYKAAPSLFLSLRKQIVVLPGFVKIFFGFGIFDKRSDFAVFLFVIAGIVNFFNMAFHGMESADLLVSDERTGMASFFVGRLCSREEYCRNKARFTVLLVFIEQVVWSIYLGIIVVIGSGFKEQRISSLMWAGKVLIMYSVVGIVIACAGFWLGVVKKRTGYSNHWESFLTAFVLLVFMANPLREYHVVYMVGFFALSLILSMVFITIGVEEYKKRWIVD